MGGLLASQCTEYYSRMRFVSRASCALTLVVLSACRQSPAAPIPEAPTRVPASLTLQPDTATPSEDEYQTVALTTASRPQEPGKIIVAVTALTPIVNQVSSDISGLFAVEGRITWDASLMEFESIEGGALLGGAAGSVVGERSPVLCPETRTAPVGRGIYAFCVGRADGERVTGKGEIAVLRFRSRPEIKMGASRLDLVSFVANEGAKIPSFPFTTQLVIYPYRRASYNQKVYGTTVNIQPSH